jgi:AMP nucleosidase
MPGPAKSKRLSPAGAVDRLEHLYSRAAAELGRALDVYLATRRAPSAEVRSRFCYPFLRVIHREAGAPEKAVRRAWARLQRPGVYETTITHPAAFRRYLIEQLEPLVEEYGVEIEVGQSRQEIPYPYVLERTAEVARAGITAWELARHFPVPQLAEVGDEIADGEWRYVEGEPRPLALFDAARVDFSLRRLVHYTGTDWRHIQRWIILTNYQRYIDQFVRWSVAQIARGDRFRRLIMPGNVVIDRADAAAGADSVLARSEWQRFQMPAYHIACDGEGANDEGITLINIGVGPSNAKNITDHLAVLRPNCWLMVGHCGGLRESQSIGDYVLAHAYLRQDRILDALVPPEIPIPALAEVQVALQDAAAQVTGSRGDALRQRLRTGTVVTNDDRNWELRFTQERKRINLSRAIAVDMESGTIAAQGFRLRVPYGTLLCVSDKPLHGEIKLPGAANAFYETAVAQHLEIGLAALNLLMERRETLHSRKLRSFDEPPFR